MSLRLYRLLLVLAAAATMAAAVLRLWPVSPSDRALHRQRVLDSIARELEDDVEALGKTLERIEGSRRFLEIVEGGGSELRPSLLFSVLAESLPGDDGWGAVFLDPAGRTVAWAGEVPSLGPSSRLESVGTLFSSTRFTVYRTAPRHDGTDARGTLVVCRTYPTGLLRPGLAEFFSWPLVTSRLHARARESVNGGALVRLFLEPVDEAEELDEIARRRAFPAMLVAAAALAFTLTSSRSPLLVHLAVRLILLLGMPLARGGLFQEIYRETPGPDLMRLLMGTPWDVFVTGLLSLLAVASVFRSIIQSESRTPLRKALQASGGLFAALVPVWAAYWLASPGTDLTAGLNLIPISIQHFFVRSGLLLLSSAASLIIVALIQPLTRLGKLAFVAAGGLVAAGLFISLGWAVWFLTLAGVAALSMLASIPPAPGPSMASAPFSRLAATGAIAGAATLLVAAGIGQGRLQRVEAVLERVEQALEPETGLARHPEPPDEVRCEPCEPWLPAGERTQTEDLARSFWVRGLERRPGNFEDVLTVRDAAGRVVSSFGRLRPGVERRAQVVPVRIPLPGFTASMTRLYEPRSNEREPLLTAVLAGERPRDVPVERIDYDAAGRPSGTGESGELPATLLTEARRVGTARGFLRRSGTTLRVLVRRLPFGFAGYSTPASPPPAALGSALASALAAFPLWFLPLMAVSAVRSSPRVSWKNLRIRSAGPGSFQRRLVTLLLFSGAVPLFGGAVAMRFALERQTEAEASRKGLTFLEEARRALDLSAVSVPTSADLNRVSSFLGADLMIYQDGRILAASRALPVAAGLASRQLSPEVAAGLAEGRPESFAPAERRAGDLEVVEAAILLSRQGITALVTIVPVDVSTRDTFDALILVAFLVALAALALGGRSALTLSSSVGALVEAAERLGEGVSPGGLARPDVRELARLSEAFSAMATKVQERTELLARERESAVTLLSRLTAAVLLFRRSDQTVIFANPQADETFPGASLGHRLADERWSELRAFLVTDSQRGSVRIGRVKESGGEGRLFRAVLVPLPPDEVESRAVLILEDLTDLLRAERLTAWVDAARAVAHDIKNPLTPIRLAAERLLRHAQRLPLDAASVVESAVDVILRQTAVLTERIGRLGRMSDPRSAQLKPVTAAILRPVLSQVAADYQITGREITVEVPDDLPELLADAEVVRDAVANFVQNSVESLGDAAGRIALRMERRKLRSGRAGIAVICEDDGPGVHPEDFSKLFEPGFSTKSRGSGMGLFATRRAVESLGGEVFAELRQPRGLKIGFLLPAVDMIFEGSRR